MLDGSTHFFNLVEECLQITNPFLDWQYLAPFWRNKQKSWKVAKFGVILTPLQIFLGTPQILKPVLGTSFQGLLPEKFWTTLPDPKGLGKNFAPNIFWGEGPQG